MTQATFHKKKQCLKTTVKMILRSIPVVALYATHWKICDHMDEKLLSTILVVILCYNINSVSLD